tara:strand:- start:568 stop:849 length:282 start_codon:yes stop_codon:yes gene_type:complete
MKCPHCSEKLGLFSKALNKFGKTKVCPHCEKQIKVSLNFKLVASLIIPVFIVHLFLLKPLVLALGFSGKGIVGIWGALLVLLSMQLKSAEPKQ